MNRSNHLDLDLVRSHFPALGNKWKYFDNAGGSQVLRGVVEKLEYFLFNHNVQTGGTYETSVKAAESLLAGRRAMATFINASRPEEIVFAASTTVALQNLARALAFRPGDEVIVTNADHESNIGPWMALEQSGVVIRTWKIDKETFELDLAELDDLVSDRTKLVAVTHVSNIIGTVNPVAEIARRVHQNGALVCVDSVAFAPHRLIDVQALDVDFLFFSAYKTFGPHFAVMYGKYNLLLNLANLYHFFHADSDIPRKLEPGNPSYELAYSLTGITEYFDVIGKMVAGANDKKAPLVSAFNAIADHEALLSQRLLEYLRSRDDCRVIGGTSGIDLRRVPTISFVIEGCDPAEIALSVEKYNLAIRYGDFYARRLVDYLGYGKTNGVVRVSMVHYNTLNEVDALIEAFEREI